MKILKSKFSLYIFSVLALLINYQFIIEKTLTVSSLNSFNASLIVLLIAIFIKYKDLKDLSKSKKIIAGIFTFCMITGEAIMYTDNFFNIFKLSCILLTIIKVIGFYLLFSNGLKLFDLLFYKKYKDIKLDKKKSAFKWYIKTLEKYPFRTSFVTILIFFSIYLIAYYPIVLSPDPSYQIKMFLNVHTKYIDWVIQRNPLVNMTNHHPIAHTYLLGWCLTIGRNIFNNDNFGLFCYTLLQTGVYASVLSYIIKFLKKNNISTKYSLIVLAIYCIIPMYGFYTVAAVKDTFYTSFMILFVLFGFDFIKNYQEKSISTKYLIYLFFVVFLLSIFRQNGIYIVFLTLPFMIVYSKKNALKLCFVFVLFLCSMFCYNKVLIPALGISDGSVREALSVPFQQTARLVKYHEDVISEEDKKIIDKVLVYDGIGERYNPTLADPVKNKFNKYTTNDELKAYLKVWFKYLFKEPATYINATLANTYGYFYPASLNWYFYYKFDKRVTEDNLVDYHYNGLDNIRNIMSIYGIIFPYVPVIGLISTIGMGLFTVLYLIGCAIESKKGKYIICLMPLITSILVCFVGPANTYFRYAMPYLFVLPVMIGLFKKEMGNKNE